MVYKYTTKVREEAYQLFAQGMPIRKIAKELGVNRHTITAWKKQFGWDKRIATIDENAIQLVDQNLTKMKSEGIKIFTQALYAFANQIIKEKRIDPETKKEIITYKDITLAEAVQCQRIILTLYGEMDDNASNVKMEEHLEYMRVVYQRIQKRK